MAETSRQRNLFIYLCLAAATVAVYWPVLHFGFVVVDDRTYVTENPHVRTGLTLSNLAWAFTASYAANWHPVTWLSHMLDCQLFGLRAGPHHLVSVLLHIANTLLLFAVLKKMTAAPWRSGFVAALFALHPTHVESVAWVAERKDVLSTFWEVLTIAAYVRYVEESAVHGSQVKTFYGLALLFYALALMSKPMVVTLPFVLLLLDYWPLGRTRWAGAAAGNTVPMPPSRLLKEKFPFLALAAALCVMTVRAQPIQSLKNLPLGIRMGNALLSYVRYIGKAFWPTRLAAFYPLDEKLSTIAVVGAGVGLVGGTIAVILRARREPWLATGWFWYVGTLVPVIGLVQVGGQSMADRYTYFPFVGLFVMLCWSVPGAVMKTPNWSAITCVAGLAALAICAVLSRAQVEYWKDSETLFRHALSVTRDNWLAHGNLGVVLEEAGREPEAIAQYEQALQIQPGYPQAQYNLGNALSKMGRLGEAMEHWNQAVRLNPDFAEARYNLGVALMGLGRVSEAVGQLEQVLRDKPDSAEAHNSLGAALMRLGQVPEAIGQYEQALRIQPDSAEAHNNLGIALFQVGRQREAIGQYEQALRIKPGYLEAHFNLAVALEEAGRVAEAIGQYEQVLRIKPDYTNAQTRLARLRAVR